MVTPPALIVLALLVLASTVTWGLLLRNARPGQPFPGPPDQQPRPWPAWLLPVTILCWLVLPLLLVRPLPEPSLSNPSFDAASARETLIQNCVALAVLFGVLTALVQLAGTEVAGSESSPVGLRPGPWSRQIAWGTVGFLACVLPTIIALWLTAPLRTVDDLHPLLKLIELDPDPITRITIIVSAVVLAPLVEELAFRVIVQRSLLRWCPPAAAIFLTALAFAMVHPNWPDRIALLPLALILGITYHRSGSYPAVVVTHLLFNATNITLVLWQGIPN